MHWNRRTRREPRRDEFIGLRWGVRADGNPVEGMAVAGLISPAANRLEQAKQTEGTEACLAALEGNLCGRVCRKEKHCVVRAFSGHKYTLSVVYLSRGLVAGWAEQVLKQRTWRNADVCNGRQLALL